MNKILKNDLTTIDELLENTFNQSIDFLNNLDSIPTCCRLTQPHQYSLQQLDLPSQGHGGLEALNQFNTQFKELIVASSGPRYWGFVTGGSTPAAIMGDILATIYDQNTQAINGEGDVSARIETQTTDLLLDLFNLPRTFTGGFVTGTTMANFSALAVARQWFGAQLEQDISADGLTNLSLPVISATPHSSVLKSLAMLGLGRNNLITIPTLSNQREAIDVAKLNLFIEDNFKHQPFILVLNAGTANTADFDAIAEVMELKHTYNCWIHIDAAFGAFAACSSQYQHLLNGWEMADSIAIDCHKWLNVPYENACFFTRKEHFKLQFNQFKNSNVPYLENQLENFNFMNILPENSRRLKALPVLFSLLAYGREGYRYIVDNSIELAHEFGNYIRKSSYFELLAEVRLNIVCFKVTAACDTAEFLQKLNKTGLVFMTPTTFNHEKGIRAAFVNWRTTAEDIKLVCSVCETLVNTK
ncbi:pyridoxal-dependent decarboxylase [Snodgrassella sp. ESL0253]|uniref:pyridoxal phosphate-dependent decarboxylase family protein n=1 Tax=Snodgrassella sp. ESL0253 TaxID=2705031 RepID=UPI00158183FB|nr:pyridoxal-dependent decarboxylase [Snodgrassella sp. ESL0253]NUE66376.1 aspartate aminotransferase family protein [Snodgrassella sp. ESL0253]